MMQNINEINHYMVKFLKEQPRPSKVGWYDIASVMMVYRQNNPVKHRKGLQIKKENKG